MVHPDDCKHSPAPAKRSNPRGHVLFTRLVEEQISRSAFDRTQEDTTAGDL
jgi:hypothetical protein